LHACNTVSDARARIGKHLTFYNQRRPHTEYGGETPDAMYFGKIEYDKAA
jgi:putative transposase